MVSGRGEISGRLAGDVGLGLVALGDVDGDRLVDVAAFSDAQVTILHLGRDRRPRARTVLRPPHGAAVEGVIPIGDVDGDGLADLRIDHSGSAVVYGGQPGRVDLATDRVRVLRLRD